MQLGKFYQRKYLYGGFLASLLMFIFFAIDDSKFADFMFVLAMVQFAWFDLLRAIDHD